MNCVSGCCLTTTTVIITLLHTALHHLIIATATTTTTIPSLHISLHTDFLLHDGEEARERENGDVTTAVWWHQSVTFVLNKRLGWPVSSQGTSCLIYRGTPRTIACDQGSPRCAPTVCYRMTVWGDLGRGAAPMNSLHSVLIPSL